MKRKEIHLKKLRDLTSHRHAISFVIVKSVNETGADCKAEYKTYATFVLRRPFSAPAIIRILRASYPPMFRERRRDYRYPIEMRTLVRFDYTELAASSINISETGMAIHSSTPLTIGSRVQLQLDLPGVTESLKISGEVRWTDANGRFAIHFLEAPIVVSDGPQFWLSERMNALVPRC